MKYGDKFIYLKNNICGGHEYVKCVFMMDRPDKKKYIAEEHYGFNTRYCDIPYSKLENIYTILQIEEKINEDNIQRIKKIDFLNQVLNDIDDYYTFNRNMNIIRDLKEQQCQWKNTLDSQKTRMVDEKIIKDTETILNDIRKGIQRRTKRVYKVLNKYSDLDPNTLTNVKDVITLETSKIKRSKELLEDLKKFLK